MGEGFLMMNKPRFEIVKDEENKYHFRLLTGTGLVVCESRGFESLQTVRQMINTLCDCAKNATVVDVAMDDYMGGER